jgi:ferredoxin, 2Fe-2S
MPQVTYIRPDGRRSAVEVQPGTSLMEAAVEQGIDEIFAECGGNATCATCHVYVDETDLARLPPMSDLENDMLDATAEPRRETSRLSCQLVADDQLDGLTLYLPEEQCLPAARAW